MSEKTASAADSISDFMIRDSGRSMFDVKDWKKEMQGLTTELTEEEKKSKFAKYYYRGLTMPSMDNIIAAEQGRELPREYWLMPDAFLNVLDSRKGQDLPTGCCVMDNGIGFSISRIEMADISDEMFVDFNRAYQPEGDIFYKSWCPGFHVRHYMEGCVEDVGLGMELIHFRSFGGPEALAGQSYVLKDKDTIALHCLSGVSWPVHRAFEKDRFALEAVAHRRHANGTGRITYVAFWHGLKLENGKVERAIPEEERISLEKVRIQMYHACLEFSQVPSLVRAVCKDMEGK